MTKFIRFSILLSLISPLLCRNVNSKIISNNKRNLISSEQSSNKLIKIEINNNYRDKSKFFSKDAEKPEIDWDKRSEEIYKETKWNGVHFIYEAPSDLSLISQGKFDKNLVNEYDRVYYSPMSGGKDIDVYVIADGFNFKHNEFTTVKSSVKCVCNITEGKREELKSKTYCHKQTDPSDLGTAMADVIRGTYYGVTESTNLYGVFVNRYTKKNINEGLKYIRDHMRPYKTVVNIPKEFFAKVNFTDTDLTRMKKLITEINNKGAVVISQAGAENCNVYDTKEDVAVYPCTFSNVLCVAGINNYDSALSYEVTSNDYRKHEQSDYGEKVNIYAPFYTVARYNSFDNEETYMLGAGNGFASSIVSGVAALIMSEDSNTKYTTKIMHKKLKEIGLKNIIKDIPVGPNLFINDGKHIVYSNDDKYYGCGIQSGNQVCGKNKCCTKKGSCVDSKNNSCKISEGCQKGFGTCK